MLESIPYLKYKPLLPICTENSNKILKKCRVSVASNVGVDIIVFFSIILSHRSICTASFATKLNTRGNWSSMIVKWRVLITFAIVNYYFLISNILYWYSNGKQYWKHLPIKKRVKLPFFQMINILSNQHGNLKIYTIPFDLN